MSSPDTPKRRMSGLAIGLASLVASLLVAEVLVRVLDLGPPVFEERVTEPEGFQPFQLTPQGLQVYRPKAVWAHRYDVRTQASEALPPDGRIEYRINELGARGPSRSIEKPAGTFRVLCLGDSFTFGEGVPYEDTYPAVLERGLRAARPDTTVEVINAGVQAYGTHGAVGSFAERWQHTDPDVITLGFFLNDATEFATTIRQFQERTERYEGSRFARASRLWEILERARRSRRLRLEYFETVRHSFRSERWEECKNLLRVLQNHAREHDQRLVVLIFPILWELNDDYPFSKEHRIIQAACRAVGCEVIDLFEAYRRDEASSLWVHPTDAHPNGEGHALAARELLRLLEP